MWRSVPDGSRARLPTPAEPERVAPVSASRSGPIPRGWCTRTALVTAPFLIPAALDASGGDFRQRAGPGIGLVDQPHDRDHVRQLCERRAASADALEHVAHEGAVMGHVGGVAGDDLSLAGIAQQF